VDDGQQLGGAGVRPPAQASDQVEQVDIALESRGEQFFVPAIPRYRGPSRRRSAGKKSTRKLGEELAQQTLETQIVFGMDVLRKGH